MAKSNMSQSSPEKNQSQVLLHPICHCKKEGGERNPPCPRTCSRMKSWWPHQPPSWLAGMAPSMGEGIKVQWVKGLLNKQRHLRKMFLASDSSEVLLQRGSEAAKSLAIRVVNKPNESKTSELFLVLLDFWYGNPLQCVSYLVCFLILF